MSRGREIKEFGRTRESDRSYAAGKLHASLNLGFKV